MKIAVFSESPADEAAIALLASSILGRSVDHSHPPSLRARGWSQMVAELPRVIAAFHYNTDVEGLIVVADSNGHAIHTPEHDISGKENLECRLCALRKAAYGAQNRLKPRKHQLPLRLAFGLAVPAFEAWLLCFRESHVNEAMWQLAQKENREQHSRKKLKELAYGTPAPSLDLETEKMTQLMTEIVKDLPRLQIAFPGGFTPLYDAIRSWK